MMFKPFKFALCAALFASLALGCSDSDNGDDTEEQTPQPSGVEVDMTESALTAADVPSVDSNTAAEWGRGVTHFGIDFMHKVEKSTNYVFSPFSLHTALSMTACGASGDTLSGMSKALYIANNTNDIAKDSGAMRLNLRFDGQTEGSKFVIANRLWVERTLQIVPEFKAHMDNDFKAPLQIVDFINHASQVIGYVNEWVSNITNNMIKNLLLSSDVNIDTRLILINAIYFDGEWVNKFNKERTAKGEFLAKGTTKKEMDMMNNTVSVNYYEDADYKAIVMPYKGEKFSMVFMLPNENDKLSSFIAGMDEKIIEHITGDAKKQEVVISLPKFTIESNMSKTTDYLKDLGMEIAFSGNADFSQMASNEKLHISRVIHKAKIEVDEEGTRAAAATAVAMEKNGVAIDTKEFKADHPFAFALIHNSSNAILFAGQFTGEQ